MVFRLRFELQGCANFQAKFREAHIRQREQLLQSPVRTSFVELRNWKKGTVA